MADSRKKVRKVDKVVCGALQDQKNCLDQYYRIRAI